MDSEGKREESWVREGAVAEIFGLVWLAHGANQADHTNPITDAPIRQKVTSHSFI